MPSLLAEYDVEKRGISADCFQKVTALGPDLSSQNR
jgi:hypothetical protein